MSETHNRCELCRKPVEPDAPGVVTAVEMVRTRSFGNPHERIEGLRVLFHEACFPTGSPRYKRV